MRAESPVPVAERSSRPGGDDDGVLRDPADALPRLGDLDDAHARDVGVLRVGARQLLARRARMQLADAGQVAGLRRRELESERRRSAMAYHMPPYATSTLRVPSPSTSSGASRRSAKQGTFSSSTHSTLPSRQPRRDVDRAAGRLEAEDRHGLDHLDHARLEEHGGDADRVRAGHRRVLGRLHDHVAGRAVRAGRGQDHVGVDRDAPARLVEEQAADRVVRPKRLHLLEDRRARRRLHARHDDVPDLAAGMTPDDRDLAARAHGAPSRIRPTLGRWKRRLSTRSSTRRSCSGSPRPPPPIAGRAGG